MYDQEKIYVTPTLISDPSAECRMIKDFTVWFINPRKKIRKQLVDKEGHFLEFPGVEYSDRLKAEWGTREIEPMIHYEAEFEQVDDRTWRMLWTIRPDGRYWMDSWGFGAEDYEAIELCSYLDSDGHFTAPFQLYSIGYRVLDGKE